jgi:NADPH:quinone reductase-like Zn-dependent oxidoreductase
MGSQLISPLGGVQPGQSVLVSGAVGSVGHAAVYTAKDKGAKVIAGVRKSQLSEADRINADQVLALDNDADVRALALVDAIVNTVRGTTADMLVAKVKSGGIFASVTGVLEVAKTFPSVKGVAVFSKENPEILVYMAEAVRVGRLSIPISQKLPLKEARQGHSTMEKGIAGKILLVA